jgi:hypothetical protein
MRGFGITAIDFAFEVQMDKLAHLIGMNPMEFRILNAYRDGDMKAHRREAHNTALIECVQVAAEKAKWPIRDEFRRMSSRTGGGGERAVIPPTPGVAARSPQPAAQQRTSYDRPGMSPPPAPQPAPALAQRAAPPPIAPATPPPAPAQPQTQHGATRFSSVFGTRRR